MIEEICYVHDFKFDPFERDPSFFEAQMLQDLSGTLHEEGCSYFTVFSSIAYSGITPRYSPQNRETQLPLEEMAGSIYVTVALISRDDDPVSQYSAALNKVAFSSGFVPCALDENPHWSPYTPRNQVKSNL